MYLDTNDHAWDRSEGYKSTIMSFGLQVVGLCPCILRNAYFPGRVKEKGEESNF